MKREIYNALRKRISVTTPVEYTYEIPEGHTLYFFNAESLNRGLDENDENIIDSIVFPMKTRNLWNVCQRVYSYISVGNFPNLDERILNA